ncbi:MAG: signal peptidase II [Paracoccus sp. (in: a-proteobacteria)]|uniref:signal peptidase II n=1 Tax=Paracoccus sp. TaxID=267 RepID=UPI00391A2070
MKAPLTIGLTGVVVLVDQITKAVALSRLSPGQILPVSPGFNLTLSFNEGASFGMMSGLMAGRPLLMAALTGALALMFAYMALRARTLRERIGLALIVGGALGNIVDRLRQGAVTDFLDLYWRDAHWPTFNAADIAISLGALLILTGTLRPTISRGPASDQS